MNEGLIIFLVVAGYFVAGFALLGICNLIVEYICSRHATNNTKQVQARRLKRIA